MIDHDKLLSLMGGDRSLAEKLIQSFKDEAEENLTAMKGYLETGDHELLSNTAHIMKTQAAYLGLTELEGYCKAIEMGAKEKEPHQELKVLIEKVDNNLSVVLKT